MNLEKKKNLAARTLGVGKKRIVFIPSRLDEIKEAITKQDIKDLKEHGAIVVKNKKGRKKKVTGKRKKRTPGNIRKNIYSRKRSYVIMTRKLRKYVQYLKDKNKISRENFIDVRNKIKNRQFRSLAHFKDYLQTNELILKGEEIPKKESSKKEIKKKETKKKENKKVDNKTDKKVESKDKKTDKKVEDKNKKLKNNKKTNIGESKK